MLILDMNTSLTCIFRSVPNMRPGSNPGWGCPPTFHSPSPTTHITSQQSLLSRLYNGPPLMNYHKPRDLKMRSREQRSRSLDRRSPRARSISPLALSDRSYHCSHHHYPISISPQSPGSRSQSDHIQTHHMTRHNETRHNETRHNETRHGTSLHHNSPIFDAHNTLLADNTVIHHCTLNIR